MSIRNEPLRSFSVGNPRGKLLQVYTDTKFSWALLSVARHGMAWQVSRDLKSIRNDPLRSLRRVNRRPPNSYVGTKLYEALLSAAWHGMAWHGRSGEIEGALETSQCEASAG